MKSNEKYVPVQRTPEGELWGRGYRIILSAIFACLVFCSHEYNPFSDFDNAAVFVAGSSFKSLDTVQIFSSESLQVRVAVKELIDSFRVFITANRLWPRPESTVVRSSFQDEPFTFFVSFYDTGWQSVILSTFRSNNSTVDETLRVYLNSPLNQMPISVNALDSVTLRTTHVKDRDVTYFWSFGAGQRYVSPVCSTRAAIVAPVVEGWGSLWVWDGHVSSPAFDFPFVLRDTVPPTIICVSDNSLVGNDTIYTGDSVFAFRVRITDTFSGAVDSASVNGAAFDGSNGDVYYALLDRVYTHTASSPLVLQVCALDHFKNGTMSRKTFWVVFSASLPRVKKIDIVVLSPSHDSAIVTQPAFLCAGRIDNRSLDSMNLSVHASVNGISDPRVRSVIGVSVAWDFDLQLVPGEDTVRIIATDNRDGSVLDLREVKLFYTPDAVDTVPPLILTITADGATAQGLYTSSASVVIGVKAFDQGSGIDSLLVNGNAVSASAGFWYYDTVALRHVTQGNEVQVTAIDKKKNAARQSVLVFRNSPPVMQTWPKSSFLVADSTYTDVIRSVDADRDTLVYQRIDGPAGLSVAQGGAISWTPARNDTGAHKVTIRVWDGYQPVFATFTLFVSLPGQALPKPVSFSTSETDFPQFLVAGRDSLNQRLHLKNGTGIAPFTFSCRIVGRRTPLLDDSGDSLIAWAPALSDTGYRQLIVIVKDQFLSTDTLYPRILVAPQNRPCSIAVAYHTPTDTLGNGTLNLNSLRAPFRLVFRIFDPDNPLVERHDVTVFQSKTHTTSTFDSAVVDTFGLTIDPSVSTGFDTITASVRDASTGDTVRVRLYYGSPPDVPAAIFPLNFSQVNQTSVTVRFSCSDPDGDTLTYDVYAGASPSVLSRIATTVDTSVTVYGLSPATTYYWYVAARDWKSQTTGQLWQFSTGAF